MFYVHIADPTYADPDSAFPFGRRLGPYLTKNEAVAQAVSDIAGGMGAGIVGVYSEAESEKLRSAGVIEGDPSEPNTWRIVDGKKTLADGFATDEAAAAERDDLYAGKLTATKLAADRYELDALAEKEVDRRQQVAADQEQAVAPEYAEAWDALFAAIKDPAVLEVARELRERTMPK